MKKEILNFSRYSSFSLNCTRKFAFNLAESLKAIGATWTELEIPLNPILEKVVNKVLVNERDSRFAD